MIETWVIISTNRMEEPYQRALEVLKTDAKLAIIINNAWDTFVKLLPLKDANSNRFILTFGKFTQLVEAANYVYGSVRAWNPSKNHFMVTIPDDMELKDGWLDAFMACYRKHNTDILLLVGNDGRSNCNLAGFAGVTDKFLDIHQKGWLLCPEYLHWFLDWEVSALARDAGVRFICPDAKAYHRMVDHTKNMSHQDYQKDEKTWIRRQRTEFPYDNIEEAPWRYWR